MRHTDEYADLITIGFSLDFPPTDQDMAEMSVLNDVLAAAGFSMEVKQSDGFSTLLISCAVNKAERVLTRNAGRKKVSVPDSLTVREVREMMSLKGADDTAAYFGVSRSTLFRRLKEDDDTVF